MFPQPVGYPMKSLIFMVVGLAMILATDPGRAADTVQVANGVRPTQTIRNWHLKEQWRIGKGSEDPLLGFVVDVTVDTAGNTYLLDYQLQETTVVGPSGKLLPTLGRRGEGPGETTMASGLLLGPGRLGLLNRFPAKIVWLDLKGDPAGNTTLVLEDDPDAILGCWDGRLWSGRIIWALTISSFGENGVTSTYHLADCEPDGRVAGFYLDLPEDHYTHGYLDDVVDESKYFNPLEDRWDVAPDGHVWIAPHRDQYLLEVRDPDGRILMESRRDYDPPNRTAQQKQKIRRSLEKQWTDAGENIIVGDRAPCIEKLWIMDNPWGTEIWVESGAAHSDLPPGVMVRYDLFDLDGIFTHQVDIVGDGDPLFDTWYLVGDNRLIMVRNASSGGFDEDDPNHPRTDDNELEVISFGIVWEE